MSSLHELCKFVDRPINEEYLNSLKRLLKSGIPSTYTIEEAYAYENNIEEEAPSNTTPLHIICSHLPDDASESEIEMVSRMVGMLLEYGAGWNFVDINQETPGCVLVRRKMETSPLYQQIVDAGVRAEYLLRKINNDDLEFIGEDNGELEEAQVLSAEGHEDHEDHEDHKNHEEHEEREYHGGQDSSEDSLEDVKEPAADQKTYLETELEYRNDSLVTKEQKDGVMMSWEKGVMKLACDTLFKNIHNAKEDVIILNIGFGMGIIDSMINARHPTKHYICEAHPDVLDQMRKTGWYDKPNVVILEGRWQDKLDGLLAEGGVFFDGIYYDTFSEHYEDMLNLFDYVIGLLKPLGIFSFFNGLGADRKVVYDVYKRLVELDLSNFGLECRFQNIEIPETTFQKGDFGSVWNEVRRPYWSGSVYYHPEITFSNF